MSAVRDVVEALELPLDFRDKNFELALLPDRFVKDEPHRERIEQVWNKFRETTYTLCRARRSRLIDKHAKKAVFASGMENLCLDFSRRTENVKVEFRVLQTNKNDSYTKSSSKKVSYCLRLTRLTDIPESLRNVQQFFVAEIPPQVQEVEAELVGPAAAAAADPQQEQQQATISYGGQEQQDPLQQQQQSQQATTNSSTPTGGETGVPQAVAAIVVPVEIVGGDAAADEEALLLPTVISEQAPFVMNPPVACEVTAISSDLLVEHHGDANVDAHSSTSSEDEEGAEDGRGGDTTTRSALERMQELDSIKMFLNAEEYAVKRQEILDSI